MFVYLYAWVLTIDRDHRYNYISISGNFIVNICTNAAIITRSTID